MTIVSRKNIHASFVKHGCVVSTRTGWLTHCCNCLPQLLVEVKVKQIVKVLASLALVAAEKIKAIHIREASGARAGLRKFANRLNSLPLILPYAIRVKIIESFLIVRPTKQVNVAISKDALMARSWRKNVA